MKKFDLKKWRQRNNMSKVELAQEMLISHDTINRIENGEFNGNMLLIESFCELYEIKKSKNKS